MDKEGALKTNLQVQEAYRNVESRERERERERRGGGCAEKR